VAFFFGAAAGAFFFAVFSPDLLAGQGVLGVEGEAAKGLFAGGA